ncbi:MAG TPA: hypothetical protein VH063_18905 [Gaiellaceae bacterium]|jgi:hypothetical protein|nr:hypothetical protein [Gaiellaceae bacterium]
MIITAALAWYDETPETLARLITSLGGIADNLIAYDGAWQHFPNGASFSNPDQAQAIEDAAREVGIDVLITGGIIWPTQVGKRAALMHEAAGRRTDWILVVDADEYIEHGNSNEIRRALARTKLDVARLQIRRAGIEVTNITASPIRRIYRADTGITLERAHNGYRTSDGRWLHGDPAYVPLEEAIDLSSHLQLVHDHDARDKQRKRQATEYYMARRRHQLERWAA